MKKFSKTTVALLVTAFMFGFVLTPSVILAASPAIVNLGSAGNFVILSKTGISTTGSTSVVGDLGLSPAAASYITGFALSLPAASGFSTSTLVTGKVYASDYASPTGAVLTTAVLDMQTAYTDAMGRAASVTELGAGNIGGLTLSPGVYKWGTGVSIPTNLTLSGGANDVWIFQIAQNLTVSGAVQIVLSGGAQASNIFWVVAGQTTIGTTAIFSGNILDQTAIVLNTGAKLNGRALAQTAVTLDSNAVTTPSSSPTSPSSPTSTPLTTTQGQPLNNSSSTSTGTALYVAPVSSTSSTTSNSTTTNIAGCTGTVGFSGLTGQSCAGNSVSVATNTPVAVSGQTTYSFGTLTLRNGSSGQAVMELQRFLNTKLNLGLAVDGKLGPKTVAIITKWQSQNNLVADGVVGAKTKAKMYASVQ